MTEEGWRKMRNDEIHQRKLAEQREATDRDEFAGWGKSAEETHTQPERGSQFHPAAPSVPKEPTEDTDEGMR